MTEIYTLPQLADLAGVEYRTLHAWVKRGLVRASVRLAKGSGSAHLFTREDALEARLLGDLRRTGLDLAALERAAQSLRTRPVRLADEDIVVLNGHLEVHADLDGLTASLRELDEPAVVYFMRTAQRALMTA